MSAILFTPQYVKYKKDTPWICYIIITNMTCCSTSAYMIYYTDLGCPFVALRSTDMTVGESRADFPVDYFCKLVRLMDTGRSQNLLFVPESESCPLK